ncbi:MAG TPA: DUF89 family protein [Syntrophomonadaceae bacterium]|nr:DUF89 family protein [Syntrophomonadaceae bacterium]
MKTYYECLPCLLRQTMEAAKMVNETPETQEKILRCVLSEMSKMDLNKTPPHMAHFIHQYIKKATQIDDPYRSLKKEFNQLSLDMSGEMRNIIQDSANPFETAVKIAIAGNIIDFGPRGDISHQEVSNTVQDCVDQPLRFNRADELKKAIQESARILYLGDNAGEIVFDRLLLELVPTDNITYVVKGKPIINDATMEDAMETGLCDLLRVIDNGSDAPGTILEICSPVFQKEFERSDLIIAKGQANYETLSQISGKKIFFLLKVKCPVIAHDLDCESGDLVLKAV